MRDAINSNPIVQAAVIGALLIGAAFFVLSGSGGGEEESGSSEATVAVAGTESSGTATGATPGEAVENAIGAIEGGGAPAGGAVGAAPASDLPKLPKPVLRAYRANRTVVLVIVREGGIDDRLVASASRGLRGFRRASVFVVPAGRIARYAAITEGVGVERVPAFVAVTPKHLDSVPTASVSYGYQSPESIAQAVIDAGYKGPTVEYHP